MRPRPAPRWSPLCLLLALGAACAPDPVAPSAPALSRAAPTRAVAPLAVPQAGVAAPGEVPTVRPHIAVSGDQGLCAVRPDGVLACWPGGQWMQPPRHEQAAVRGRFVQVAEAYSRTCALRDDGLLECFGSERFWPDLPLGQVGPRVGRFVQVAGGNRAICALRDDGIVECWGGAYLTEEPFPRVRAPLTGRFTKVSVGTDFACGVRDDGALECWGDRNGWTSGGTPVPELIQPAPGGEFDDVRVGDLYLYAHGRDGQWMVMSCCEGTPALSPFGQPGQFVDLDAPGVYVNERIARIPSARTTVEAGGRGGGNIWPLATTGGLFVQVTTGTAGYCVLRDDGFVQCRKNSPNTINDEWHPPLLDARAPQTITVASTFTGPLPYGTETPLPATTRSGLPVEVTSLTPTTCTIGGTKDVPTVVGAMATGTCRLTLAHPGNARWQPAPALALDLPLTRGTATILRGGEGQVHDGTAKRPTLATQPAGLPVQLAFLGRTEPPSAPGSYFYLARVETPLWTGAASGLLTIEMARIDVQPARISLATSPTVTVYVHGSAIVDAARIDPATVRLRVDGGTGPGAAVALRNGAPMSTLADVDRDGRTDRMLVFRTADLVAAGLTTARPALVLEDRAGALRLLATDPSPPQIVP